jgi:hypothetical protein
MHHRRINIFPVRTLKRFRQATHSLEAEFVEVSNADHLLSIRGKLAESVVPAMLTWMKKQLAML